MNQSNPTLVDNHLTKPRDFMQAVLHVSSEALLLLGYMVESIRAEAHRSVWPPPADVG